jgi:hypothetical protein
VNANSKPSGIFLFICVFMVLFLGREVYIAAFFGKTMLLRSDVYVALSDAPLLFGMAILVKVVMFFYCAWYVARSLAYMFEK